MRKIITTLKKKTLQKDQGGESINDGQTSDISTRHRENLAKTLDIMIETIRAVHDLVPIDTAKNILTGISTILVHLRASLKNKDGLKELLRNCEDICSTLVLATKGIDKDHISDALKKALDSLELSIGDLQSRVEEALQRGRARRFLGATLEEKEVGDWTSELNRILTSLSAKLNIVTVIRLEQIYESLKQPDVPNLIPDPPPPPPAMFFGRDDLLRQLRIALLRDEDIALIGPGGIGKSTIAIAVMNDEDVIQSYRRRFFVTYDGLDPTKITFGSFMDRIANVLGLPMSGADSERQVKSNLGLSRVLLVLDNAETFEDASNRDEAKQISDFISHVANTAGVTVLLTSRTSGNARRVSWTQIDVPPLEREPARLAFRKIYHGEIDDDDIDQLLAEVDFHPLSISILAYTARENRWSGKNLLDKWNAQRSSFLQMGDGKDNLGFTIRLSLDSPSVKALGDDAPRVLRIIAFLPQGINQDYLTRLFPTASEILSVADTLCRVSLILPSGSFLTTLAPVRLFLLESLPIGSSELEDTRRTYYNSLKEISETKDTHADLLVSDHLNIEHLIAFDIPYPPGDNQTILACRQFLFGLAWHRLRPTLLAPLVPLSPEESSAEKYSKAHCLHALGYLYFELSIFSVSGAARSAAMVLFVAVGDHSMAAICISHVARSYHSRGYFSQARRLLDDFMCSPSWHQIGVLDKAEIYYALDLCLVDTSLGCADRLFLRSVDHSFYGLDSRIRHWIARMHHGHNTPQEVEGFLEPLRSVCMSSSDFWDHWMFLAATAEVAFLQERSDVAMELLDQAHESLNGNFRITLSILNFKAVVASAVQGDHDLARSLLRCCLDTSILVATPSSIQFLWILYIQGLVELYARNYSTAHQLLMGVVVHCDACDEIRIKSWSFRALGEVEILRGHQANSDRHFARALELCEEAGAPPELLGIGNLIMKLDDNKFPGWKRFLRERIG